MAIVDGLIVVAGLVGICTFYYYENIYPYLPQVLFKKLKSSYRAFKRGEVSYHFFKEQMINECVILYSKDSKEMVEFKLSLPVMLLHKDFMISSLSEPEMTYYKMMEKWKHFDPDEVVEDELNKEMDNDESDVIDAETVLKTPLPEAFSSEEGLRIVEMMCLNNYCDENFNWKYKGNHASYLMVLFADAIGCRLNFTDRWKPFKTIWGKENTNFSDLISKATASPDIGEMLQKVQSLFPEYTLLGKATK